MTALPRKEVIKQRLKEIERERNALLQELAALPVDHESLQLPPILGSAVLESTPTTSEERIDLFTRLFRCREDVFPKLWENQSKGTKGYSPACQVEWVHGVCEKPKIKCSECHNRVFIPLDQTIIRLHLEGSITIGSYAIRQDDTFTFLAADFDKEQWQQDVSAYKEASEKLGIEPYIERSRSGNGAHAWIFFREPIPARLARQLGTILLSHAIGERHRLSFESYDRFFPNQDTIPKGGFGNLIALPLQRKPRKTGNSVFVDDHFNPWPDQWAFLSKVRLLSNTEVINFINTYSRKPVESVLPESPDPEIAQAERLISSDAASIGSYTGEISIVLSNHIEIPLSGIPSRLIAAYKRIATFANPKFFELQRLRFSTWKTPRYICCAELSDDGKKIVLPRGLFSQCIQVSESTGANVSISDHRPKYNRISIKFTGELLSLQSAAVRALIKNESGVLVAPPGAGKTVIGCALICKHKLPTLILVHRKQLADQWKQRLLQFTNLTKKQIGIYDLKDEKRKGIVDIGMFQSLAHSNEWIRLIAEYGFVITSANGKKERSKFIEAAITLHAQGKQAFLLSTGSLIGEGFDLPELCTLVLAMPLSFKGRLVQYAGRLHRESPGKKDIRIYDYVDVNLGLGITMFRKRLTTYRKMGYTITMPPDSKF